MKPRIPTRMKVAPISAVSSWPGVRFLTSPRLFEPAALRGEPFRVPRRRPELTAQGEEDLDHDRVELRADAVAEPAARFLDRQAPAVGPIRRHCVERIADEDDPRLQGNRS